MNSQKNSSQLKKLPLLRIAAGTLMGAVLGVLTLSFSAQAQESFEDNPALRDLQEGSLTEGSNTLEDLRGGARAESDANLTNLQGGAAAAEGARNSGPASPGAETDAPPAVPTPESPVIDSPTLDSPASNSPASNSPAIDSPAIDSPAIDSPAIDSPTLESPTLESPTTDSPTSNSPNPTFDAAAPDSSANVVARLSATSAQATVQLTNNTGAEITYEVIGQTQPRSLAAGAIARLDALPLPTTITAEREDFGLVDMGATVSPEGVLEVSLERSEFDEVQGALHIRQDGYVFVN
jgi:hypothetical protein